MSLQLVKPKIIGLTGNIACGKSTVGKLLQEMDILVLDSDTVVHDLYANDPKIQAAVLEEFGTLDRKEIGAMVFGTSAEAKAKRKRIEEIIHPAVDIKLRDWIRSNNQEALLVNSVPLLFEAKLEHRYDYIVTVTSSLADQVQRLQERCPDLSNEEIMKRISSQMKQEEKAHKSNYVLDNSRDLEYLRVQVQKLVKELKTK